MNDSNQADAPILGQSVLTFFKRSWWAFLLGGIASTLFGLLALVAPGTALVVLALYFAASILVDGAVNAIGAIQNRGHDGWWIMLIFGIAGILIGGYALLNPPVSIAALILLTSLAALILGIALMTLGYKIRAATEREWMLYLAGALSLIRLGSTGRMRACRADVSAVQRGLASPPARSRSSRLGSTSRMRACWM